jgi:PKD domain/RTX calcium-binding nonapeptide repeat (4 copies)
LPRSSAVRDRRDAVKPRLSPIPWRPVFLFRGILILELQMKTRPWIRNRSAARTHRKAPNQRRLALEALEERTLLANYVAPTVADLITDIGLANSAGGTNTISPGQFSVDYDLSAVNNTTDGANGLPVIAAGDNLTIEGPNGTTIERNTSGTNPAKFRLFDVAAGATLNLQNLTLETGWAAGTGVAAQGGAIYSSGTLTLNHVFVYDNLAVGGAGGTGGTGGDAFGGGLYVAAGTANLAYADFDFNFATGGTAGTGGSSSGDAEENGGTGGTGMGGGVYVAAGTANLTYSIFTDNFAQGSNGGNGGNSGNSTADGGTGGNGMGGGVNVAAGVVALANDTFYGNSAGGGSGGNGGSGYTSAGFDYSNGGNGGSDDGGGLYVSGGAVTLTNDTVSGNTANNTGGLGGNPVGIGNAGRVSEDSNGGGLCVPSGNVTLNNSLIAGNVAGLDWDVCGNLDTSSANDLIEVGNGSNLGNGLNGSQVGVIDYPVNPLLGPLQNNGGFTETMALLPGSPAIDAGSTALAVDPTTGLPLAYDQRGPGFARIVNGTVDIGAFEVQPVAISTTTAVTTSAAPSSYGDSVTFTATVTGTSTPTGSVDFVIDSGTAVAGTAGSTTGTTAIWTFATSMLTAGTHTVQAFYVGTGSFANSNGTLTGGQPVNAAALTITANNVASKTYGTTLTPAGTVFSTVGLVNGDTVSSVTLMSAGYAATATVVAPGPNYTITPSAAVFSAGSAGNYHITYDIGNLTVTAAPLTVSANSSGKLYGTTSTSANYSGTLTGVVAGDNITASFDSPLGDPASATVAGDNYPIVATLNDPGGRLANYNVTNTSGALTVYTPTSAAKYVQALFQYELGRAAAPAGVTSGTALLGTSGEVPVASGIINSAEERNDLVGHWYQTYLGRAPSTAELSASVSLLATQTEEQVLSQILGTTEYYNDAQTRGFGGTADQNYITALFEDLLGRAPASAGLAAGVAELPVIGRQGVALGLLQGQEYRTDVVSGYYTSLLGSAGTSAQVAGWVSSNLDLRTIRTDLESSQQFFVHAASEPPTITSFTVPATDNAGTPVTVSTTATNAAGSGFPLTYTWTFTPPAGDGSVTTLTGATATFATPGEGSYGVALTVADQDGFSASRTATVAVADVPPTPALSGPITGVADQVLTYTAAATDPSTVDVAAGFTYSINWGDGTAQTPDVQTIAASAANGSPGVKVSHDFTTAGTYTVALTATDKYGGATTVNDTVTVLALTSANLATVISQQGSITTQATTDAQAQALITAVNGLSAPTTATTVTINLGSTSYTDTTASPPANTTLVLIGIGSTTTIVGHSPALAVSGGTVIVSDVTLVTDTDAPTIQVSGGNLVLRNDVIEETTCPDQAALQITGGTVDLGTANSLGGNTFDASGGGELIHNAGPNPVSALGNTFEADNVAISSPYSIEDRIFDALDENGAGLVTFVANNVYVTPRGGSIQRGVDAVAAGGTVNVEAVQLPWGDCYAGYNAGTKLVTIAFENGPVLTQQADTLNPSLRSLVVEGGSGNGTILFTPDEPEHGGGVQVLVNNLAPGTFDPTGRLIAYAGAGNDNIQVSDAISLPAFLYGGAGNDWLQGGGGDNVLVGGGGKNVLIGGPSRDLMIGGSGASSLIGVGGDDLMIAGTTAYDANDAALSAIMAEWTSGRSYATRLANLSGTGSGPRNNGNIFLIASGPNATVFDNGVVDELFGGDGQDWFFASLAQDIIHGRRASEIVENL